MTFTRVRSRLYFLTLLSDCFSQEIPVCHRTESRAVSTCSHLEWVLLVTCSVMERAVFGAAWEFSTTRDLSAFSTTDSGMSHLSLRSCRFLPLPAPSCT